MTESKNYWKKFFGVEIFKVEYYLKWMLYNLFGLKLPKLKDQRNYWDNRAVSYMDDVFKTGYHDREVFFQNMIVNELKRLDFESCFEAGCGFGWNIRRMKEEFKDKRVGGLDFCITQLINSNEYLNGYDISVVNGDNCTIPFKENAFDIGFSLGVFMNIHPDKIEMALKEMTRACKKYIIHLEWDAQYAKPALSESRAFKTNIVSHDYKALYESLGKKVVKLSTYKDFEQDFINFQNSVKSDDSRWEGFEGPDKYVLVVVDNDG